MNGTANLDTTNSFILEVASNYIDSSPGVYTGRPLHELIASLPPCAIAMQALRMVTTGHAQHRITTGTPAPGCIDKALAAIDRSSTSNRVDSTDPTSVTNCTRGSDDQTARSASSIPMA